MKSYVLQMTPGEADALVEIVVRGINTTKRSGPDEIRVIEKITSLGQAIEDAR